MFCVNSTLVDFPLPALIVAAMRMLWSAATVMFTSPFVPTAADARAFAYAGAEYDVILPVVGLPDGSVTTCRFPETYQLSLIVWSTSADATSARASG